MRRSVKRLHLAVLCVTSFLLLGAFAALFYNASEPGVRDPGFSPGAREWVDRQDDLLKKAFWIHEGRVGALSVEYLPPSQLSHPLRQITLTANGRALTTTLPTDLWELDWPGIHVNRTENLNDKRSLVERTLRIEVQLWLPLVLCSVYPVLTVFLGPFRRHGRTKGWRRAVGWTVVSLSATADLFVIILAIVVPKAEIDLLLRALFFLSLPGIFCLALLLINKPKPSLPAPQ